MHSQSPRLTEAFATLQAFEGLLFGVDVPVVPQVVLSSEGFVADVTCVRSLICVRPLMDQKIVRLGEMSSTELADKLFLGLGGHSPTAGPSVSGERGRFAVLAQTGGQSRGAVGTGHTQVLCF